MRTVTAKPRGEASQSRAQAKEREYSHGDMGVKRLNSCSGARTSPAVGGVKSGSLEAAE